MKKIFLQGLIAGILAAIAAVIYFIIYQQALDTHFNKVVNAGGIIGGSVLGCMLMAVGYALLNKFNKNSLQGWLNLLIAALSFASIIGPISMSLPMNISSPELFPGLVVPMHFFPALAFFCIHPFFHKTQKQVNK